jgi:hypothetical protein
MKIDFSLKRILMIVDVHYRIWVKFAQKLQRKLVLCKTLHHKGLKKLQSP